MPAGPVMHRYRFLFISEKYAVSRFHPLARSAVKRTVYFQLFIASKCYFIGNDQFFQLPAAPVRSIAQVAMWYHAAS